jgi:hypothetical protein
LAAKLLNYRTDLQPSVLSVVEVPQQPDALVVENVSRQPVIVYVKTLSNSHSDACQFAPYLLGPGQSQTFGPSEAASLREEDPDGRANAECDRAKGKPFDFYEVCVGPCQSWFQIYVRGTRLLRLNLWYDLTVAAIGAASGLLSFLIRPKARRTLHA